MNYFKAGFYYLKLYWPVLWPCIVLIGICFLTVTSPPLGFLAFLLIIIWLSVLKVYVTRLDRIFVVICFPWSKYRIIYQNADNKFTKQAKCEEIVRQLIESEHTVQFLLKSGWYRMITHDTVLKRIKKGLQAESLTYIPLNTRNLINVQRNLFANRCKKCTEAEQCFYRRSAYKKRTFYFVEFFKSL